MTNEKKHEFTLRISQANSTELVVILYEMLLCYLEDAAIAIRENDLEFHESVRKARGCLNELINSTHVEYEPGAQIMQLYMFCLKRLAKADVTKDAELLTDIRNVIEPLHDAYEELAVLNTKGPVMDNTQTIYAGLTYGRNVMNLDMQDIVGNRGLFA
ncbi:MAG: flagellar protein FliS [Lachnospiraceae bacterium]|nr:flagellar protein FliS [Lachnospiraceae bacterium]